MADMMAVRVDADFLRGGDIEIVALEEHCRRIAKSGLAGETSGDPSHRCHRILRSILGHVGPERGGVFQPVAIGIVEPEDFAGVIRDVHVAVGADGRLLLDYGLATPSGDGELHRRIRPVHPHLMIDIGQNHLV